MNFYYIGFEDEDVTKFLHYNWIISSFEDEKSYYG